MIDHEEIWPMDLTAAPSAEMLVAWQSDSRGRCFARCPHCRELIVDGLSSMEVQGTADEHYVRVHLPEVLGLSVDA